MCLSLMLEHYAKTCDYSSYGKIKQNIKSRYLDHVVFLSNEDGRTLLHKAAAGYSIAVITLYMDYIDVDERLKLLWKLDDYSHLVRRLYILLLAVSTTRIK